MKDQGSLPDFPDCPLEPWVVLASMEVNENGVITEIDNCSCRRIVAAFGHFWWQCQEAQSAVDQESSQ
jgi:hypothetical protein